MSTGDMCSCRGDVCHPGYDLCEGCIADRQAEREITSQKAAAETAANEARILADDEVAA